MVNDLKKRDEDRSSELELVYKLHFEKTGCSIAMKGNACSSSREVIRTAINSHVYDGSITAILSTFSKTAETVYEQINQENPLLQKCGDSGLVIYY